jgi:hypothetical protein
MLKIHYLTKDHCHLTNVVCSIFVNAFATRGSTLPLHILTIYFSEVNNENNQCHFSRCLEFNVEVNQFGSSNNEET